MEEFGYEIKIPKERVAVLIGKDGEVKQNLEKETKSNIDIDSKEGDVEVRGKEALLLFCAREIIKAIGRGFNPDVAMRLLKQDYAFELIYIGEFVGENHFARVKGRVIGKEGKSRELIEKLTECNVCVYGKTVGIIGTHENVLAAKRAVESLLSGSTHSSIYRFLEGRKRSNKRNEFLGKNIKPQD